ncbi:alcohol dehydrogenase family protein [Shewanella eurypsychrophilus]|uniref:Alcohol dehydrogenase family protein n=1 Tax=Shewanella eurypsychrophilus TaxID=2593656 RepID=A0ABX6VA54_9GAMM|nr:MULTISPECIES: alcohol dehydrogenase family protein [Shewanella]QPG57370.2 alcohol dehydrogenase family protein [Shewanella eurypsychrophilus]
MTEIPKTMKGVQLIGHGGLEMLQYRDDIPVPTPTSNEVLICVSAAGVNNTDINTRTAWYSKSDANSTDASWSGNTLVFPRIQGADVCGTIVAVGDKVNSKRIGERVIIEPCLRAAKGQTLNSPWYYGSECDGGFAQYTLVDSQHAYAVNSPLSDTELASFPCSYSTAENMLTRSNVTSQDTVLISGASGGVGSAAIQLAKARGAHVIAITSPSKNQQLLELGADRVVARDADLIEVLGENSIDVIIDLVAGKQWPQFLQVLKPGSRYAVSGAIGGALVDLDVRTLYLKDLSFFGCTVLDAGVFQNLVNCIEQGKIRPLVAHTFPLEEINIAQERFLAKQHIGKIVLKI